MILALELSGPISTVALASASGVLERDFSGERGRALIAEVDALVREADIDKHAIRGILVGRGPGSYTGLRIACAAARTLGHALGIPVGGVGSFPAAALNAPVGSQVHIVLDAYRGEIYHAVYKRTEDGVEEKQSPRLLATPDLRGALGSEAIILGDPELTPGGADHLADLVAPRAKSLIQLALAQGVEWDGSGVETLGDPTPLYLRAAAFRPAAIQERGALSPPSKTDGAPS